MISPWHVLCRFSDWNFAWISALIRASSSTITINVLTLNHNLCLCLEIHYFSVRLLWNTYFQRKFYYNQSIFILPYIYNVNFSRVYMFCALNTHSPCIAGGVPCTRPLWSATRGACRLMIPCRWPTSAPRVPRLGSLVVVVQTVMTLSGPDLRFHSDICQF